MFYVLMILVPAVFAILYAVFEYSHEVLATICAVIAALYFAGSVVVLVMAAFKMVDQPWVVDEKPYSVEHIVALNDGNSLYGRFYISRGYIDEKSYYRYMVETEDGGFVAGKAPSDSATLYYTDSDYRVEWYNCERSWFCFKDRTYIVKIYIPEGSIVEEFAVDLE